MILVRTELLGIVAAAPDFRHSGQAAGRLHAFFLVHATLNDGSIFLESRSLGRFKKPGLSLGPAPVREPDKCKRDPEPHDRGAPLTPI
jgi:hypothetical protein